MSLDDDHDDDDDDVNDDDAAAAVDDDDDSIGTSNSVLTAMAARHEHARVVAHQRRRQQQSLTETQLEQELARAREVDNLAAVLEGDSGDIDVDAMSYDELLALGEVIGSVSTGIDVAAMIENGKRAEEVIGHPLRANVIRSGRVQHEASDYDPIAKAEAEASA